MKKLTSFLTSILTSIKNVKFAVIVIAVGIALLVFFAFRLINSSNRDKNVNPALVEFKNNLEDLQKKAAENPKDYTANKDFAYALYVTSNNEKAAKAYTHVVALNPQDFAAYNNLGTVYRKEKKYEEAVKAYEQSIKVKPQQINAYINLAQMYIYDMKQYEKGAEVFAEAIAQNPDNLNIRIMLAKTYEQHKNTSKAKLVYEEILKIDPKNAEALTFMEEK